MIRYIIAKIATTETKTMQKTLIALAIAGLSSPLYAQIHGKVLDESGLPVNQASVDVVGTQTRVKTNAQGEFSLPATKAAEVELHIKAPDYIHKTFHVKQASQGEFVLSTSAIEVVNIIGLPMHQSNLESSQPVNVISVDELRDQQSSSLGEALKYEVGIHSSYFSSNSASPIIRGMDGPRVLITQNGLDASDASRVGPDHAVSTETSYAQQVEVLRGPATLFYGSGAIGGVVNVVDDRIPKGTDTYGEWRLENHSAADDKLISASGNTGFGNIGLHADGFWRDADDYKIPGPAEINHEDHAGEEHDEKHLHNSWTEASGGNIGASYIDEQGFVGLSVGQINRQYGIPGHSHGDEAVDVYADVEQTRWQLQAKRNLDSQWFSSTGFSAGYTDYQHAEIEGTEIGTTFKNKTSELRWELFHQPLNGLLNDWRGAISLHYKHSDFSAVGEEAFTPPSETETIALGLMEEKHIGSVLLQLGARVEQVNITADNFAVDLNQPHTDPAYLSVYSIDHESTPFSVSAGAVWDFTQGYNAAISLTHAERTPAASELLSFGPHIGSGLYEVGYLLTLATDADDEFYFQLNPDDIELEKSNNIDISLRKHSGDFGFILNGFFNRVDNFYYLSNTGFTKELEHHHEDEAVHYEGEAVEFPVFIYQTADVDLWGYEAEFMWQALPRLELILTTDSIRAEVNKSAHLPRIPPRRYGLAANYEINKWRFNISSQHYSSQNRFSAMETETDGYFLLDSIISYSILPDLQIFLKGYNLTDEYARVHSSFLKDKAPLPGRNIALGISGRF